MNKQILREMISAVGANIEYLKSEGNSQLIIKNGSLIRNIGEYYIYEFCLEFLQDLEMDSEIELRIDDLSVNGKIISLDEKLIQIEVDTNLGLEVSEAKLIISNYYLLQMLYDRLNGVENGRFYTTDLAEKTYKLKDFVVSRDDNYRIPYSLLENSHKPNEYQEKAIRLAMGSEVSYIWGPPGTGKTKTIARIIEGFISKGMSVLLISHTNLATDGALCDFVRHMQENEDYREGKYLRIGDIKKDELKNKFELVIPRNIVENKSLPIKKEIDELTKKIDELRIFLKINDDLVNGIKRFELKNYEKFELLSELEKVWKEIENLKTKKENIEKTLLEVEEEIVNFQGKNFFGKLFSGTNIETLIKQKKDFLLEKEKNQNLTLSNKMLLDSGERKLGRIELEIRELEQYNGKNKSKLLEDNEEKKADLRNLKEQIDLLNKQVDELVVLVVKEAKVIATTLTKSYSDKIVLERSYDCVIIDEASMAPLPALWCATGLAKQKVVVVGDFYQLSPVVKHRVLTKGKNEKEISEEEKLINNWLKRDIFEFVGIRDDINQDKKISYLEQLRKQYRMHPDISDIVNFLVYAKGSGKYALEDDESTYNKGDTKLNYKPLQGFHVGVFDTNKTNTIASKNSSGSFYNIYNALLAVELAEQAVKDGYLSIGIVVPFRAQANLLQKMIIDRGINEKVEADTVHRFQGGEKEIIIFDIVTPIPTKLTDDRGEGGDDEKLINVAFSRAKEKLLLIADIDCVLKKHDNSSLFVKFLKYSSKKKIPFIDASQLLNKYYVTNQSESWLEKRYSIDDLQNEVLESSLFDEKDFYRIFVKDLLKAKKEVIIDSPYITENRMNFFYPLFSYLISKDVKIFVTTRFSGDQKDKMKYYSEEAIKQMEKMGIVVLPFKGKIHRKLAIIDRKIVYEGSLNILSQRDSKEIMRRFVGIKTAKQIINFLRFDKNIGKVGDNHLRRCEFCKDCGAWYWNDISRYGGFWTFCLIGGHKEGIKPKSKEELRSGKDKIKKIRKGIKKKTKEGVPICQVCNLEMVKKTGRFGDFWGCRNYPKCRNTEKI